MSATFTGPFGLLPRSKTEITTIISGGSGAGDFDGRVFLYRDGTTNEIWISTGDGKYAIIGGSGAGTVTVATNGALSGNGSPDTPLLVDIPSLTSATVVDLTADWLLLAQYDSKTETFTNRKIRPHEIFSDVTGDVEFSVTPTGAAIVTGIRGTAVSETDPIPYDVLMFDGTNWVPTQLPDPPSPPPPPAVDVGNIPGPLRIGATETVSFTTNSTITLGSTTTHLRLNNSSGGLRNLQGITGGAQGRVLYVTSIGSDIDVIQNATAASAGNRLLHWSGTTDAAFIRLAYGETMTLVYQTNWNGTGVDVWEVIAPTPIVVPASRVAGLGALATLNTVASDRLNLTTGTATGSYSVPSGTFTATGLQFASLPAGTYLLTVDADVGVGISAGPDAEIQCELWNSTAGSAIATRSMNKGFGTAAVAGRHSFFVLFTLSATSTVQLRARRLSSGSPTWSFSNLSGIVMTYIRIG